MPRVRNVICRHSPWRVLLGIILAASCARADPSPNPNATGSLADEFFAKDGLVHISIQIPERGIANLRTYHWRRGQWNPGPRPKAIATVRQGGREYRQVSIHLKGSAGSFRSIDRKPALTLNFDKHVDGQTFHGLDKFYLNNSVQDDSYCNEKICRELFNAAGIPTPRATHATVELNGRQLGLYVLVEGFNKRFLRQHFEDVSGNLYDGGFVQDVDADLHINSGDNPENKSELKALVMAASDRHPARRLQRLEEILHLDKFISHIALDVLTWNWDGYALKRPNNYRLYHDKDANKLLFIPHGMDQMFEDPYRSIFPGFGGYVAYQLMDVPEIQKRYFNRMRELFGTVFKPDDLMRRVAEITRALQPDLMALDPRIAQRQAREAHSLQQRIKARGESVSGELRIPDRLLSFDDNNTARLTGWRSNPSTYLPVHYNSNQANGRTIMSIVGTGKLGAGKWATKVWLEQGNYTVKGRMRFDKITPRKGMAMDGVIIRTAYQRIMKRFQGSRDWFEFTSDFTVTSPYDEVEVACDFRGHSGRVWFDQESIVLIKH